jgi:Rha family phage regulatory protein
MMNMVYTIDSREVAQIVDKRHTDLLRDIRGYIHNMEYGGERKIASTDFFQESTYVTGQNKLLPCYLITRKGCEFIANKLTGQKGTVFTAIYINRFHEMEQGRHMPISASKPQPCYINISDNVEAQKALQQLILPSL